MNSQAKLLWQLEANQSKLVEVAKKITASLENLPYFCLWMEGEIGAGKTTLAGEILRAFGLDPKIPVNSPTYSYINDYEIASRKFAHIDLYRAAANFSPDELFHLDEAKYQGLLVEWPEVVSAENMLGATHRLKIEYKGKGRVYSFFECAPGPSS
jgi:tRNA threonylcarbamoyl adenosine modification protein YjeE